jgi:hypothetical protein
VAGATGPAGADGPAGAGNLPGASGPSGGDTTVTPVPGTATVGGTVFADPNGIGSLDASDAGLAGRTVFLDLNGNGQPDPGEPSAVTDSTGSYLLSGVTPGNYTLQVQTLPGDVPTAPTGCTYSLSVAGGTDLAGQNFGLLPGSPAAPTAPAAPPLAPAPAASPGLIDLASPLIVSRGKLVALLGGRVQERVTIANLSGEAFPGPVVLVLENLTRRVRLRNRAGFARSADPFVVVPNGGNGLGPGESMTLTLLFINPLGRRIRFVPRVVAGTQEP